MQGQMQHQPDAALAGVMGSCRAELSELYGVVQQEQKRKLQRWQDEEPMLECQIEALTGTRDIIQREQKQLTTELANLKALLEKQAAETGQQAGPNAAFDAADEARLQEQLQELSSKVAQLDEELTDLVPKLSGAGGAGCKPDELSYYETKLVVIQDTRRLLQAEATALSAEIKRRQTAARLAADRDTAAQLGLSDLGRLGERLAGVEVALDRAKVERYFPAQRGFRFSGGGGGVYCGVKDLHLSEVSGAFNISLEAVPAAGAGAAGAAAAAQREVRLKVTLSGIATGASSQEYKQQQQRQKQQQAAKAAAQAKSLKRQQTYQQQQQQQQQQGSPLRRAHSRLAPDSPSRQQHSRPAAGPGGGGSSGGFSSGGAGSAGGSKRNAAIAKFLGQLNDKKDALSNAIKTSPLSKGLEGSSSPRGGQPRALNFSTGSPGSGFTRHLAGTFGDKAAGFSQRLGQQNAAAGSSAGLLGGLAGTGLHGSSSGDLLGSACGSTDGSNAAAAASSIDGSSASMLAAADHPAAAGHSHGLSGLSTTASTESGSDFTAAKQPPPDSPTASSSLQGPGASMDSRCSGSWPTPESPQDGQLKAKLGSMKGKLGGLLADSKQKLADSKLMQESKQKLAESKQKLADSKFISESRAAAKHLLEDSKHLFEDGKAGLKKGLSNLQDKPSHGQPGLQQQQHPSSQGSTPQQGSTPRSSIDRQQQQQQQDTRQQHVQQPLQKGALASPSAAPEQLPGAPPASAGSAAAAADLAALAGAAAASSQSIAAHDGAGPPSSGAEQRMEDAAAVAAADENATEAATAGGSSTAAAFPAVTAATAAAASTGEQERHLLDEAWVGDEQGGMHASSGGGSSTGWLPGSGAAAAAAAGVAGGKGSGSRKGVVVMLLAEGLEILGEKGTKVPNIRAAQLGLEVECVLSACLTYSSTLGWQSAGLSFEVVSLERVVEGSNIPVPKTLIKSVLNLVMPSVFTKLLLTSLPHELGQFILDSAATAAGSSAAAGSNTKPAGVGAAPTRATAAAVAAAGGAGVWLSGELCLAGPPLACLSACLTRSAEEVPAGRVSLTNFVQELRAAQKARALLSLPDPLHTRALALLFTPGNPYCLLNTPAAAAAAGGSATVSSGSTVLGLPASLTLRELCRFYLDHSDSSAWPEICAMWQVAVDAVCLHLAREDGLLPPAADAAAGTASSAAGSDAVAVTPTAASDSTGAGACAQQPPPLQQQQQEQFSFNFEQLLNGRVAALVRKPVRLSFGLNKLLLGLDAAAGLAAARDYCERAAREFAESAKGEDALLLLQRPLSQQLELLHLWHAAMSTYLATFLQQFKETGGRVMLAADKGSFSIAVEELTYEGPMRLQIPLPLLADLATGACTFELRLPNPEFAVSSLTSKLRFVSSALSKAAFGKCEQECAASRHAAAVEAAIKSGTDLPLTLLEELDALMTIWNAGTHEQQQQQQQLHPTAGTHTGAGSSSSGSSIKLSRAASSNQRSSSTAAAAATASITRNSLTNAVRTSSVNAGSDSAPGSSPGAVPDAAAAASTAAASNGDAGRDSATPAAAVDGEAGNGSSAGGGGGCGDAGSAAGGGGMIGRVCMTKASAGLVLDEKRLKELMAGGGLQDAGLLGGVLACFGQLFTATIAPGWPAQQDSSLLAASMEMGGSSGSGNSAAIDDAAAPQTIVTVRNNEVTRVKAALEAATLESAVSPRIAVRLLHMLVLATAHKFGSGSSKRLEVIHKVFTHVAEYLGRDCLDLLVCVDVAAAAVEPTPGAAAAGSGAQGSTLQQQQQGPALQLLLAGAAPGTGPGAGAGPTGGSTGSTGSSGSTGGACCYIINDVNLLTVLETVRLLMEYSS